jgi:hypothetical protein
VDCKWQEHWDGAIHPNEYQDPWMLDTELQDFMFALLGFGLALAQSFHSILFLPFGMGMFTLCHCILGIFNFLFDFFFWWYCC